MARAWRATPLVARRPSAAGLPRYPALTSSSFKSRPPAVTAIAYQRFGDEDPHKGTRARVARSESLRSHLKDSVQRSAVRSIAAWLDLCSQVEVENRCGGCDSGDELQCQYSYRG